MMARNSFQALRLSWLALTLSLLLPGSGMANCFLTPEVDTLVDSLERVLVRPGPLSTREAGQIRAQIADIRPQHVAQRLTRAGYPSNTSAVEALMSDARDAASRKSIRDRNILRLRLARVRKLRERVCAAEARLEMKGSNGRSSGSSADAGAGAGAGETASRGVGGLSTSTRLALVPTTLASIVGASYAGKLLYVWVFALMFNRRKCRIPAQMKIGVDVIDGHISILGRKGCRFHPASPKWLKRMEAQAPCINAHVHAGGLRLAASLEALINGYGVVYFHELLPVKQQQLLLALSKTSPTLVSKTSPKAQRKKRKKAQSRAKQRAGKPKPV